MRLFLLHLHKRIRALPGKAFSRSQAWWRWLLGLSLTMLIVSACSGTAINHSNMPTAKPPSTTCRVVQHKMGATCVPNHPKRMIIIANPMLSHALILGVKPMASASLYHELKQLKAPYLSTQSMLGNRVEGIINIGLDNNPNLEKILQLKPDFILASDFAEGVYPLLAQIAPTVMIPYDDLINNWKEGFNLTAKILGKEAEAQQVWNHYHQRIEALKTALGDRYRNKTFSIAFAYGQRRVILLVKNSLIGSIFADLGLQRPSAQDVSVPWGEIRGISEETLDLADADILFFGVTDYEHGEAYESLKQRPLWNSLNAVRQGQVYIYELYNGFHSMIAADLVINDLYKYLVNAPDIQ